MPLNKSLLTSLCLSFVIYKDGIIIKIYLIGFLGEVNELIHIKELEQCFAHSKYPESFSLSSCSYDYNHDPYYHQSARCWGYNSD